MDLRADEKGSGAESLCKPRDNTSMVHQPLTLLVIVIVRPPQILHAFQDFWFLLYLVMCLDIGLCSW